MPFARYVVRSDGRVDVGNVACSMCHTRVMPDGMAVLGAQGNFPVRVGDRRPSLDESPATASSFVFQVLSRHAVGRGHRATRLERDDAPASYEAALSARAGGRDRAPGHEPFLTAGASPT